MFTGIIEGLARVSSIEKSLKGGKDMILRIDLGNMSEDLRIGDSVSINGTCLTVVKLDKQRAEFEVVKETNERTAIGSLKMGDMVNIEKSLRVGGKIDGHIVLGHVDCIGTIDEINKSDIEKKMWIKVKDPGLMKFITTKGSVAIDGISLTVTDIDDLQNRFAISLIPHTAQVTTLGFKKESEEVNIEVDVVSRYLYRFYQTKYQEVFQ